MNKVISYISFAVLCALAIVTIGPSHAEAAVDGPITVKSVTLGAVPLPILYAQVSSLTKDERRVLGDALSSSKAVPYVSFNSSEKENRIVVTYAGPVARVTILPRSRNISPTLTGSDIVLVLPNSGQYALQFNDDPDQVLHIFANSSVVRPSDKSALVYFGPGRHEVDELTLVSGQTLYLDVGAVLCGRSTKKGQNIRSFIHLNGEGITISGYGTIDGHLAPSFDKDGYGRRSLIRASGRRLMIENVTLRDSSTWSLVIADAEDVIVRNVKIFGYRNNSDGIDICNSSRVKVERCFIRSFDDLVVVKTPEAAPRGGPSRDIVVEDCVLWNEFAHALSIGAELRNDVEKVRFLNCDIIHDSGREWLMRVFHSDSSTVRDVSFVDIRCEATRKAISLWIGQSGWSRDARRGNIRDVLFKNIFINTSNPEIELQGDSASATIEDVRFEGVWLSGRLLSKEDITMNGGFIKNVVVQ